MKNIKSQILLILICFTANLFGQSLPKPIGFVNDFENIFTDKQEQVLDSLVKNFEKETTIQVAIVTLDSSYTNKSEFDNYTFKLANNWGVGQKDKDNGILIGISSSLRKMRIQNGYGIKKILSDQETKLLIDSLFIPDFKQNNYYDGTKMGIIGLINKLSHKNKLSLYCSVIDFMNLSNSELQNDLFFHIDSIRKFQYPNNDQDSCNSVELTPELLTKFLKDLNTDTLLETSSFKAFYHFNIFCPSFSDNETCKDKISVQFSKETCNFRMVIDNTYLVEQNDCIGGSQVVYSFRISNNKIVDFGRQEAG